MGISNLRKESSERSDSSNWAKKQLINNTDYYFDSIEGCSQNTDNRVTHLFERARFDFVEDKENTVLEVVSFITSLEEKEVLQRKINFAKYFGLPLSYILYCDENQKVILLEFETLEAKPVFYKFKDYTHFSNWLAEIKGWKSSKAFRENRDLPHFDQVLRKAGTAWPTNIDCFISNKDFNPIGIIEFQNADSTEVQKHCNNDFMLCQIKTTSYNQYGPYTVYHDDIRRWTSLEILRVQSGLRLYVITWDTTGDNYILKEVEKVTIPHFPTSGGSPNWNLMNAYKSALHDYVVNNKLQKYADLISQKYSTYSLSKSVDGTDLHINTPPLNLENKTFPSIYYRFKELVTGSSESLSKKFINLINMTTDAC